MDRDSSGPLPSEHQNIAACGPCQARVILPGMGTKSRDGLYGSSVRMAAERASEARKQADKL